MKVNKLWIVILVILIVGCWTTSYTKRYRDQLIGATVVTAEQEGAPETTAAGDAAADSGMETQKIQPQIPEAQAVEESGADAAASDQEAPGRAAPDQTALESAVSGQAALGSAAPGQAAPGSAASGQAALGSAAPEAAASDEVGGADSGQPVFEETAAAPVSGAAADTAMARAALPVPEAAGGERVNSYLNRLNDLDARLEEEQGAAADTTNSMKAAAEQERKLWETELNRILDALEERLPDEEMQELFKAQKEWMRERESIAVESSKKKSGSTLEEVEYNVSLADTTRSRAYELAEQYASVLTGAE